MQHLLSTAVVIHSCIYNPPTEWVVSELIKRDCDVTPKLAEYCNGSVKWHFANIMPADCEVTSMVMKIFIGQKM